MYIQYRLPIRTSPPCSAPGGLGLWIKANNTSSANNRISPDLQLNRPHHGHSRIRPQGLIAAREATVLAQVPSQVLSSKDQVVTQWITDNTLAPGNASNSA